MIQRILFILCLAGLGRAFGQTTPGNDNFESRAPLDGVHITTNANNMSATKQAGEPNLEGNTGGKSLWWTWTAPQNGTVTIKTEGSDFDTLLGVFTGASSPVRRSPS